MDFARRKRDVEAGQSAYCTLGLVNAVETHSNGRFTG